MDTVSGCIFDTIERMGRLGVSLAILALALLLATFVVAVVVAEALGLASEPVLAAPFRWSR